MESIELLQQQYQMITGSREVVLNFAGQNLNSHLLTPLPQFADKSIAYLLVHNANVYIHWLANFAMQLNIAYAREEDYRDIFSIKALYAKVDHVVISYLNHYENRLSENVNGITASGKAEQSTPLNIFTHVITHEFHHKGQILSMFRLLGKTPPDTDVIRF